MIRIGITGHQRLKSRLQSAGASQSEAEAWEWVEDAFAQLLQPVPFSGVTVVSSLAVGADQRLSRIGLDHGATLEVVVPSFGYVRTFDDDDREEYEQLLARAVAVIELGYPEPSEEAYFAAGKCVVDRSDTIVAVWDGQAAGGLGGTADIVAYARESGREVVHLDPIRRTLRRSGAGASTPFT